MLLLLALVSPNSAWADFVVIVGNMGNTPLTFVQGQIATIPVYAYTTVDAGYSMRFYTLGFDVGTLGVGVGPGDFSEFGANFALFGNVPPNAVVQSAQLDFENFDVGVINSQREDVRLPTIRSKAVKLFDLTFSTEGAVPGIYDISFRSDATTRSGDNYNQVFNAGEGASPSEFSGLVDRDQFPNLNRFTITAVPEVSPLVPMALLGGAAGVLRLRGKWKKKSIKPANKV